MRPHDIAVQVLKEVGSAEVFDPALASTPALMMMVLRVKVCFFRSATAVCNVGGG